MKSTRSARPRTATLVSVLVVATAILAYALTGSATERLAEVVIEIAPTKQGLFLIQTKDAERRLDDGPFGPLTGKAIEKVDVQALEAYLEADPFVARAEVYARYDGTVYVSVGAVGAGILPAAVVAVVHHAHGHQPPRRP